MIKHCILIVDDEPNVRSSLTRLFQKEGYDTLLAENAEDAFALLEKRAVSAMVSDYTMPGQTGVAFLKEVKNKYPKPVRMILSGKADMSDVMNAVQQGIVAHFFLKPWDNDVLRKTVRKALDEFEKASLNQSAEAEEGEEVWNEEELERTYPGITVVKQTDEGTIIIDE